MCFGFIGGLGLHLQASFVTRWFAARVVVHSIMGHLIRYERSTRKEICGAEWAGCCGLLLLVEKGGGGEMDGILY